ncbi:MAG: peptidoglycan editing factor PgeF [Gemmatimonas sp.]
MSTPLITTGALLLPGVRHGFFTREGGVSTGIYASLNVGGGSKDDRAHVAENRARAATALGVGRESLVTVYQVHSATAVTVAAPFEGTPPQADGMATSEPGLALGILTADCAPILFADPHAKVIGAAHAGWRGALNGIAEATVSAMVTLGASRGAIRAAVGPCIGPASYEVGPEFPAPFLALDPINEGFFRPARRERHYLFDLPGYVGHRLRAIGLAAVEVVGLDTCADETRFFSYRRSVLRGEPDYGRGLSAIALVD